MLFALDVLRQFGKILCIIFRNSLNMESYFIRHAGKEKLNVVDEAIDYLWEHNKIAIHYPGKGEEDKESINPDDYEDKVAKRAMHVFNELNNNGGYIWAEYRNRREVKVGKIVPHSFAIYKTRWASKERVAKLKTLQIDKKSVKIIPPHQAISLRAVRPRGGTLSRWPSAKNRLKCLVEGLSPEEHWDSLFPSEQETVCSEYLREPDVTGCPILERLLLPVGRTLQDVDIYGYATDKKRIFAQVTYFKKEEAKTKIQKLKDHDGSNSHLIFFCNCKKVHFDNGILFIPLKRVENWLKNNKTYLRKLLEYG